MLETKDLARFRGCAILVAVALGSLSVRPAAADEAKVSFSRDVRPILGGKCFKCHGPDEAHRESGLRLDQREAAIGKGDSELFAIVPGKPDESELIRRITSTDESEIMPPPDEKKPLTPEQIATLRRWVEQGAKYESHWAFAAPAKQEEPKAQAPGFSVQNAIDNFIGDRLQREKLTMSPEADKATLLRRV
jgi:hypothetical protein